MGGLTPKDELSLYPLQWMLLESASAGLVLEFDGSFGGGANIDNPINVVLPRFYSTRELIVPWELRVNNKLVVSMRDLGEIHRDTLGCYEVKLNKSHLRFPTEARETFTREPEGDHLRGYCSYGEFNMALRVYYTILADFDQHLKALSTTPRSI